MFTLYAGYSCVIIYDWMVDNLTEEVKKRSWRTRTAVTSRDGCEQSKTEL